MDPYRPPDDPELENPYAPPQSTFQRDPLPELVAGTPFTVADVFNWSWAIFKEKMWLCISIFWSMQGVNLGISLALGFLAQAVAVAAGDAILARAVSVAVQLLSSVVGIWLGIGQARAYLKIARGEPASFGEIFQGGPFLMTTVLATIVFVLILFVPIVIAVFLITLGMVAAGPQSAVGIILFLAGSSLAAVFVVYVSARLALYYYLIIDRDAGAIDSLRQSWELCQNRSGMILLVFFLNFAIVIGGLLAFCVGAVFAMPLATMLLPVTYLAMTGTRTAAPGKPEFIWEDEL